MKKTSLVIGIDGGGTKTTALLADLNGNTLAEAIGGPSNFQVIGTEQAAQVLYSQIHSCCSQVGKALKDIGVIVAGLSGAGRESDKIRMRDAFIAVARKARVSFPIVEIESDARIALEGAFSGSPGIILISGTGSIAYGKAHDGSILRTGGWGRILGDEGSGYTIGRHGLTIVCRQLDGRMKRSMLTKLVEQVFGFDSQEKIISAVYREQFEIASVAPLVIEAATKGDEECARIVNRAAFELTELVRTVTLKLEEVGRGRPQQKLPLALYGGLITAENVLRKILCHKITFSLPQIKMIENPGTPEQGAVRLAIKLAESMS